MPFCVCSRRIGEKNGGMKNELGTIDFTGDIDSTKRNLCQCRDCSHFHE